MQFQEPFLRKKIENLYKSNCKNYSSKLEIYTKEIEKKKPLFSKEIKKNSMKVFESNT